jgi:hypothetical protein
LSARSVRLPAAIAAARGVWRSVFYSAIAGWAVLLALVFAATDVKAINTAGGGSIPVIETALSSWAAKLVLLICTIAQLFLQRRRPYQRLANLVAFSRGRGIPGWALFRRLNAQRVPLYAVLAVSIASLIITIPAYFGNKAGRPMGLLRDHRDLQRRSVPRVHHPCVPTAQAGYGSGRATDSSRAPGHWADATGGSTSARSRSSCSSCTHSTFRPSPPGVPWNHGFTLTAVNYSPLVRLVGVIVAIWWQVSAKNKYTGPVRTIDTDDLGGVIEPPPGTPPGASAVAGGAE